MDSKQERASAAVRRGQAEADPTGAAASAVVAMVVSFLDKASDLPPDSASFLDGLRTLPPWRENPLAWARALREVLAPFRLPTAAELAARSTALDLALSSVTWAHSVMGREPVAAARNLTLAASKAGALSALVFGLQSDKAEEMARRAFAKGGGKKRWADDPISPAKVMVRKRWEAWQEGRELHKGGAAFAREMVREFDAIKSTVTVERWARNWRKDREAKRRARPS